MKILSWNILQGGGKRAAGIAEAIKDHRPDVVTLQEFRNGSGAKQILMALDELGLGFIHVPETTAPTEHTILIASKYGFDAGPFMPDPVAPLPILEAAFSVESLGFPLTLLAVHFPQKEPQVPLFQALIDETPALLKQPALLIGDLNCGIPYEDSMTKSFYATSYFQRMLELGWIDTWRSRHPDAREFSWYSSVRKNGFRYDQALASKSLNERIQLVEYDASVRESGHSDHSALSVLLG